MNKQELREIPLNQIHATQNYRLTFRDSTLAELAASIKENGVLEPIIVRPNGDGFSIVAGERRVRAATQAGLVTIPAVIRAVKDIDITKLQVIENVQREPVPYMEEAYALKKVKEEQTMHTREVAAAIGKSPAYVHMQLKLCDLDGDAKTIAEKGWISKGVAWEIAKLEPDDQVKAANALARTNSSKQITVSGAKSYIQNTFGDSHNKLRKERVAEFGAGSKYLENWKKYLLNFNFDQFERFKNICRGRTQTEVLAEAVDLVMRRDEKEA